MGTESRSLEMCLFPLYISRSLFLCRMWRRCRRSTSWTGLKTQRSASGRHLVVVFFNDLIITYFSIWLFMQVVAHLCEGTLGGSRPPGAEDGYWTGQNEIHSPTLQVNAFNCFEKSIVWQKKKHHLLQMDQKELDVTESFVISLQQWATVHTSVFKFPELIKNISKCTCWPPFLLLFLL